MQQHNGNTAKTTFPENEQNVYKFDERLRKRTMCFGKRLMSGKATYIVHKVSVCVFEDCIGFLNTNTLILGLFVIAVLVKYSNYV